MDHSYLYVYLHEFLIKVTNAFLQMLVRRFEFVKHKLRMTEGSNGPADWGESLVGCCSFPSGMLFFQSAVSSWQDTLLPVDNASLHLDMELLQELTSIDLYDEDLHQVRSTFSLLSFLFGTVFFSTF